MAAMRVNHEENLVRIRMPSPPTPLPKTGEGGRQNIDRLSNCLPQKQERRRQNMDRLRNGLSQKQERPRQNIDRLRNGLSQKQERRRQNMDRLRNCLILRPNPRLTISHHAADLSLPTPVFGRVAGVMAMTCKTI